MSAPNTPDTATVDYLRSADLRDLAETLKDHRSRAIDVVASAESMAMRDGGLVITADPIISDEGVTNVSGLYRPTRVAEQGLGNILDIPVRYLRRMREHNVPLLDKNVNDWYGHETMKGRKHLYRLLVNPVGDPGGDGFDGVVRAVLSDSYKCIDNFDILMASLHGMRAAGIQDPIISADLTETRMVVRVTVPQVAIHAPEFLKDYRNPFNGVRELPGWTPERVAQAAGIEGSAYKPGTEPILFAGFVISNSETGGGAFRITPRLEVRICRNGLTIATDATKEIHLGGKLSEGLIEWSEATRQANIQLVMNQTTDVVKRFISPAYVQRKHDELLAEANAEIKPSEAPEVIATVAKALNWTKGEQDSIIDFFMEGGQFSASGVMQAVSAAAQRMSGDAAFELENTAIKALSLAGAARK